MISFTSAFVSRVNEVKEIIEIGRKVKKKEMLENAGVKDVSRILGRYT
jgi:hypothetical protein